MEFPQVPRLPAAGVLLVELLRHAKSLPLDLLLELLRRMPAAREQLAAGEHRWKHSDKNMGKHIQNIM